MENTLGIYMICKDEIQSIGNLLDVICPIVDEVVVLDTGSTDGTFDVLQEKTKSYTNMTLSAHEWNNDFGEARNIAMNKLSTDFAMWLDCDDILNEDTVEFIKNFGKFAEHVPADVYMMKYLLSRDINGNPEVIMGRERITRMNKGFKWIGFIHEYLSTDQEHNYANIPNEFYIEHHKVKKYTSRNLDIYESKIASGVELTARDQVYYGNELYYNGKYKEAIERLNTCVQFNVSWYGDLIDSCIKLANMHSAFDDKKYHLMNALKYGPSPRPDILCLIGDLYKDNNDNEQAAAWYEHARLAKYDKDDRSDIVDQKYLTWYPYLMLSVVYYHIDKDVAKVWHEYGSQYYPDIIYFKNNDKWFK